MTVEAVEGALGRQLLAQLGGVSRKAVSNWKKRGTFPRRTYPVLTMALAQRGRIAPASLWKMDVPQ